MNIYRGNYKNSYKTAGEPVDGVKARQFKASQNNFNGSIEG